MDDLLNGNNSGSLYYYDESTGTWKKIEERVTIDLPVDETYYVDRLADKEGYEVNGGLQ